MWIKTEKEYKVHCEEKENMHGVGGDVISHFRVLGVVKGALTMHGGNDDQ